MSTTYNPMAPSGVGARDIGSGAISHNFLDWKKEDMVVKTGGGPGLPGVPHQGWPEDSGTPSMPIPVQRRKDYSGISERQNVQIVLPFFPKNALEPRLNDYVFATNAIMEGDISTYHITYQSLEKFLQAEDVAPFTRKGYTLTDKIPTGFQHDVVSVREDEVLTVDHDRFFNSLDDFNSTIMHCGPLKEGSYSQPIKTWGVRGDIISTVHRAVTIKGMSMIKNYWQGVSKGEQVGFLVYYDVTDWSLARAKAFMEAVPQNESEERYPTTVSEIETYKLFRKHLGVFFDPTVLQITPVTRSRFENLREHRLNKMENYYQTQMGMHDTQSIGSFVQMKMEQLTTDIHRTFGDQAGWVMDDMADLIDSLTVWHEARMAEKCRFMYMPVGRVINNGHYAPGMDGVMVSIDSFVYRMPIYDIQW